MGKICPIIVLGAARSGTRLVRRLIASAGLHAEVPFDINYIWRYGNESCPDDCLHESTISADIRCFIRERIAHCAGVTVGQPFVEKTVSNVLRIPFVRRIYPEARFVFLVRNGRDVIESAHRCWKQPPAATYLFQKIKTFPWWPCRGYAWRYANQIAARSLKLAPTLRSWGPRYSAIDDDVRNRSLLEVCCRQWVACMEAYERDRQILPANVRLEIRYEDLVHRRYEQAERLAAFIGASDSKPLTNFARTQIHANKVGNFKQLSESDQCLVEQIAGRVLDRWHYTDEHAVAA